MASTLEKEERKEGKYLIEFSTEVDKGNHIRWGWIHQDQVMTACSGIVEEELDKSELLMAISFEWAKPHILKSKEFILNYNMKMQHTVVDGRQILMSEQLLRDAFLSLDGKKELPSQVPHEDIADWFPIRDRKLKWYLSRRCVFPKWSTIFQLLSCLLLARRRPWVLHGQLALFVKKKFENDKCSIDFATYMLESLEGKIVFIQKHISRGGNPRYAETLLGDPWKSLGGEPLLNLIPLTLVEPSHFIS